MVLKNCPRLRIRRDKTVSANTDTFIHRFYIKEQIVLIYTSDSTPVPTTLLHDHDHFLKPPNKQKVANLELFTQITFTHI